MPQTHEIKINLPGLLRMLGENIYSEPDVAVREMIQNAHDTCIIRTTRDDGFGSDSPQIQISFDRARQTLTIADNGAGMTEEELHKNLATIGESFTRLQKDELRGKDARQALLIGQFGIGLLSAFSISRKVEVTTRSYSGDAAFRWVCGGDITYEVEACAKADVGTCVVLHLLDSKLELLEETRLRQAIKKYADFLSVPILLNGSQANAVTPPWEQENTDLTEYIQSRWGLFPLGIIPFDTAKMEAPGTDLPRVSGLLFVPMISYELTRNFGELDVYISRMFIKANDKDLLPRWASFVKGVINTPDLTPTLSRGEIINDDAFQKVRDLLGHIIIGYLDMLQENDPDKLTLLVGAYNNTIKARSLEDDDFFDRICHLIRVNTDRGQITLQAYLEKSGNVIYFFAERGSGTQHKVLFAHKGLPVIDASWGVEEEFLEKYAERKSVEIERLSAGAGAIFTIPETVDEKWQALERDFHLHIQKEAKAVEFEPETVPAVLVARPLDKEDRTFAEIDSLGAQAGLSASAIKQMFGKISKSKLQRAAGEDTILHINTKSPLMHQLRDMPRSETFRLALVCIYNNALTFSQGYVSPESAKIIFEANNSAFSAMIANARALRKEQEDRAKAEIERDKLKRQLQTQEVQLTEYRSCFFAFDYKNEDNYKLLDAVQAYFDAKGLGIKVMAPAREMNDLNIHRDLHRQLKQAHFGIAEVSNNNLNVLYESGLIHGMGKPLILLQDSNSSDAVPFDIFSDYRCKYDILRREGAVKFGWLKEELEKAMNTVRQMLPEFNNVPKFEGQK